MKSDLVTTLLANRAWQAMAISSLAFGNPGMASAQADTPPYSFPYGAPEEEGASADALSALHRQIANWVQAEDIVGGEILVIKNDRILLHEVVGWSRRERAIPLDRGAVYHVASMTKPFIGTAVLMLVEDGLIGLDQRVAEILPSFDREATRTITVRQLLTHTAGWANEGPGPGDFVARHPDLMTLVDAVAAQGPSYPPGQEYRYGDAHSWTLGAIVEAVTGQPSEHFIEERMLSPLGLADTRMGFRTEPGWAEDVIPRYRRVDDRWVMYWDPEQDSARPYFLAAGGAYSTAMDYARWLRFWMDLVISADATGPISPELAREAVNTTPLHPGYGFHWFVYGDVPLVFGHGGSDGTRAWVVPSERLIVVYLTQSRGNGTLGALGRMALDAAAPGLRMRARLPEVPLDSLDLEVHPVGEGEAEPLLGDYVTEGETIAIRWEDGRLRMLSDFWAPYDLWATKDGRFVMTSLGSDNTLHVAGPPVRIEFGTNTAGNRLLRVVRAESGAIEFEAVRQR